MLESNSNHIYAYGTIGSDYTGAAFAEALRAAARCGDPVVHLHTGGGSVTDGMLMITAMQQAGRPTTVVVEGLAASMGAVFMLSASRVRIARNALVMVHSASIDGGGNRRALEQQIETLHKVDDVLRAQFYRRGLSRATVDGWFDGADHWFTADEAIKWGIADEITDAVATVAVARDVRPGGRFEGHGRADGVRAPLCFLGVGQHAQALRRLYARRAAGYERTRSEAVPRVAQREIRRRDAAVTKCGVTVCAMGKRSC